MTDQKRLLHLGYTSWVLENRSQANTNGAIAICLTDADATNKILQLTGLTHAQLLNRGQSIDNAGTAEQWAEGRLLTSAGLSWGFRKYDYNALKLDAVIHPDPTDEIHRYKVFPQAGGNTCAIDAVIALATLLNVGRVRIDQIAPYRLNERTHCAQTLLHYLYYRLSQVRQSSINTARDYIFRELQLCDPDKFQQGRFAGIVTMMEYCFQGLPQFSWTTTKAYTCCDWKWRMEGKAVTRNSIELLLREGPIGPRVRDMLIAITQTKAPKQCSNGDACDGWFRHSKCIVLDRFPPRLIVNFRTPLTSRQSAQDIGCFDTVNVIYRTSKGLKSCIYSPRAMVFHVGSCHWIPIVKIDGDSGTHNYREVDIGVVKDHPCWWPNGFHGNIQTIIYEADRCTQDDV